MSGNGDGCSGGSFTGGAGYGLARGDGFGDSVYGNDGDGFGDGAHGNDGDGFGNSDGDRHGGQGAGTWRYHL